jgi:hypothetical protein
MVLGLASIPLALILLLLARFALTLLFDKCKPGAVAKIVKPQVYTETATGGCPQAESAGRRDSRGEAFWKLRTQRHGGIQSPSGRAPARRHNADQSGGPCSPTPHSAVLGAGGLRLLRPCEAALDCEGAGKATLALECQPMRNSCAMPIWSNRCRYARSRSIRFDSTHDPTCGSAGATDAAIYASLIKRNILDSVGRAIAALPGPPFQALREAVRGIPGSRPLHVDRRRQDVRRSGGALQLRSCALRRSARQLHGALAASVIRATTSGPSLAAAEQAGASGEEFMLALAVAYEIQCRFTAAVPVMAKGFNHATQPRDHRRRGRGETLSGLYRRPKRECDRDRDGR